MIHNERARYVDSIDNYCVYYMTALEELLKLFKHYNSVEMLLSKVKSSI